MKNSTKLTRKTAPIKPTTTFAHLVSKVMALYVAWSRLKSQQSQINDLKTGDDCFFIKNTQHLEISVMD